MNPLVQGLKLSAPGVRTLEANLFNGWTHVAVYQQQRLPSAGKCFLSGARYAEDFSCLYSPFRRRKTRRVTYGDFLDTSSEISLRLERAFSFPHTCIWSVEKSARVRWRSLHEHPAKIAKKDEGRRKNSLSCDLCMRHVCMCARACVRRVWGVRFKVKLSIRLTYAYSFSQRRSEGKASARATQTH